MIIRLPLRFEGGKGEKYLSALFDSGATYSCIASAMVNELAYTESLPRPMKLVTAHADTFMEIKETARLEFYHDDIRLTDEFMVVPGLSEDVIIGAQTMQKWKLKLDFENDRVLVDPAVARHILINLIEVKSPPSP